MPDVLRPTAAAPAQTPTVSGPQALGDHCSARCQNINLPLPELRVTTVPTPTVVPGAYGAPRPLYRVHRRARRHAGRHCQSIRFSFEEIAAVNGIDEPWTIQIGETILIPRR